MTIALFARMEKEKPAMDEENWFYAKDGSPIGPVTFDELREHAESGVVIRTDYVWSPSMTDWVRAREIRGLFVPKAPPVPPEFPVLNRPKSSDLLARKIAAGVCGVLFGAFGVHKFILGRTGQGFTMLLWTVLTFGLAYPITQAIGIIEGIIYLAKTDDDFYRDYYVQKRGWF